ncbi:MAG: tetratricopeptide repeat protein, partial [Bacteroidia bacterium]|nr:tetratricopeptide repeat protein [Bacteroidia bacterium]
MRVFLFIPTFLLISFCSFSQNKVKSDSLFAEPEDLNLAYQTATHDTTKIHTLLSWGDEFYLEKPDSAFILYSKAAEIAKKNLEENFKREMFLNAIKIFNRGLANAYNKIGFMYKTHGEIERGLEYYFLCLKIDQEMKDTNGIAVSYNNIAVIYVNQGELEKALEYHFYSLKLRDGINDKKGIANSYNNIAIIYSSLGENEKALEYFLRSIKIFEEENAVDLANGYWNISTRYLALDDSLNYILYLKKAAKDYFERNDSYGMASGYYSNANILFYINEIDSAIYYYKRALSGYKQMNYDQYVCWLYRDICKCLFNKNDVVKATIYADSSLNLAKKLGYVNDIKKAAKLITRGYKKQGKFEDALTLYGLQIEMQDSLINEDNQKQLIRQQMKYEYEKEQILAEQAQNEELRIQNEELKRRNSLHYFAIFIGLLVLFGGVIALGFVKVSPRTADAIIFISFLILFEFILILVDPYIEEWTGGAPGYKLLFNAILAGAIFPLHQFFEEKLKKRLVKVESGRIPGGHSNQHKGIRPLMIALLVVSHSHIFAQKDTLVNAATLDPPAGGVKMTENSKINSLRSAYKNAKHDTDKLNALSMWATDIYLSDPDSALILMKVSAKIGEKNLKQETNLNLPSGQVDDELIKLFKKGLSDAYNNIGYIYKDQGEIEKALEYYFLSLKIKEDIKDKKGMASTYHNIGGIYDDQGETKRSLEYYFLSLKIQEEINDKEGMAYSYNNIGVSYCKQGELDPDNYQKALEYYFFSLKLREEINDKAGMAVSYHNIGNILCNLDSIDKGMEFLELALKLAKELGYKARISDDYSRIGSWQLKLGQLDAALKSGLEALAVSRNIGHVEYMKRAAKLLSDVYKKQGNFKDALSMYELEIEMRDSIVNEENQKATIRQQMKYEYEKEQILAEQARKDQLRVINEQLSRRDN